MPEPTQIPWRDFRPRGAVDWIAVSATLLLVFCFGAFDVHTYDTGLYVAKGRYTIEHREIPTPEQMLCSGKPTETSHTEKWLFQIVVYALDAVGGPTALVLFGMAALFTTFGLLALAARHFTAGWVLPAWAVLLGCLVGYERFTMRPELITFPLAAAFLLLFERAGDRRSRSLWLLPLLQVVWTNSHPLFPMGPLLCAIYGADPILRGIWRWWRDEEWPESIPGRLIRHRVLVGLAVVAACLVNPKFHLGALYPFKFYAHIQNHADVFTRHVTEFKGTFDYEAFPTWAVAAFKIALVLLPIALVANARRTRPAHWLLFLAFAWLACALRRNLGVFAVVAVPLLAIHVHGALARLGERLRARAPDLPRAAPVAGAFLLAVTAIYFAVDLATGRFYFAEREPRRFGFGLTEVSYPVGAVNYIERENLHGNAFVNWDAGSYLLWAAYPKSKPYISSEGDYSFALYEEYSRVLSGEIPWPTIAGRYNIRYVLIRYTVGDTEDLIRRLAQDPEWVLSYADSLACVFLKQSAENSAALTKVAAGDPIQKPAEDAATAYERAHPWFRLGILYDLLGRPDDALRAARRAVELYPGYSEAQNTLGAIFATRKEFREAEAAFRASIEANPHYFTPYMNLGKMYFLELEDPAKAEDVFRVALAATLDRGWFRALGAFFRTPTALLNREIVLGNALGKSLYLQKKYDEAEDALKRSLAVADNYEAHSTLFVLYRDALKDPDRAQRHYELSKQMEPK